MCRDVQYVSQEQRHKTFKGSVHSNYKNYFSWIVARAKTNNYFLNLLISQLFLINEIYKIDHQINSGKPRTI